MCGLDPLYRHEDGWLAVLPDCEDRERGRLLTDHTGRPLGHSRKRDALDRGAFSQEFLYRLDRNMSVHDIAADKCGVAALKIGRDARLSADLGEFVGRLGRD